MEDNRMLYKMRTLEKLVFRKFLISEKIEECKPIPPTQFQIMEYIFKHDKTDIYQKDLENILKLRRATVSGVLQTMERNELIERITDSKDTRTKKIILKKIAKDIYIQTEKKMREIENIIIKDISQEELNNFSRILEKMKQNIEQY